MIQCRPASSALTTTTTTYLPSLTSSYIAKTVWRCRSGCYGVSDRVRPVSLVFDRGTRAIDRDDALRCAAPAPRSIRRRRLDMTRKPAHLWSGAGDGQIVHAQGRGVGAAAEFEIVGGNHPREHV